MFFKCKLLLKASGINGKKVDLIIGTLKSTPATVPTEDTAVIDGLWIDKAIHLTLR